MKRDVHVGGRGGQEGVMSVGGLKASCKCQLNKLLMLHVGKLGGAQAAASKPTSRQARMMGAQVLCIDSLVDAHCVRYAADLHRSHITRPFCHLTVTKIHRPSSTPDANTKEMTGALLTTTTSRKAGMHTKTHKPNGTTPTC
eukprot:1145536-Pelagomonas_calceolata.AAC.4